MKVRTAVSILTISIAVSGCETLDAITFQSHDLSYVPGSQLVVRAQKCVPPKHEEAMAFPAAGAAVILGAVNLAATVAGDELSTWLDRKKKEFSAQAVGTVNTSALFSPPTEACKQNRLGFETILISQPVKDADKSVVGLTIAVQVEPDQADAPTSAKLSVKKVTFARSSAKTGSDGLVDVDVRIAIAAIAPNEKSIPTTTVVTDQTLHIPGLALPDSRKDRPTVVEDPSPLPESAWFPLPKYVADAEVYPTSIAVQVTETGSGSPDFGLAKTETADGIKSFLGDFAKWMSVRTEKK